MIAGGDRSLCAVKVNGQIVCVGRNNEGQLGIGSTTDVTGGTSAGTEIDFGFPLAPVDPPPLSTPTATPSPSPSPPPMDRVSSLSGLLWHYMQASIHLEMCCVGAIQVKDRWETL